MRFTTDASSGRYMITVAGQPMAVDLCNLRRTLTGREGDAHIVSEFLDAVVGAVEPQQLTVGDFYWCLERNDYADRPPHTGCR